MAICSACKGQRKVLAFGGMEMLDCRHCLGTGIEESRKAETEAIVSKFMDIPEEKSKAIYKGFEKEDKAEESKETNAGVKNGRKKDIGTKA